MLTRAALTVAALACATPTVAQDFRATNKLTAGQITPAVYEVVGRPGKSGASNFWCAAAEYARQRLGASGTTRIYVSEVRGPSTLSPGRSAVRFTLDPIAAGIEPITPRISLSVDHVGDNIRQRAAEEYCLVEITRF